MKLQPLTAAAGLLFTAALVSSCATSGMPASALPSATAQQQADSRLCVTKCTKCHELYDPREYEHAEWEETFAKMTRKAKLTPDEASRIRAVFASLPPAPAKPQS